VGERKGGERGLKYDIMKSELKYTFYQFTSWTMSPERKYAWPKIKRDPVQMFNKALFHARLGVPLRWADGYCLAGDRWYPM
jgi:hypothetical protein